MGDISALIKLADGQNISVVSILLLLFGVAMAFKYVKGIGSPKPNPEVQISAVVYTDMKAKLDQHETRISRLEGRLDVRSP